MERRLKMRALVVARVLEKRGLKRCDAARRMAVQPKTLESWRAGWRKDRLKLIERGRRPEVVDRDLKNAVVAFVHLVGPGVGLPTLEAGFKDVPRAELERILAQYRVAYLAGPCKYVYALRWMRPGAVWAIDHTDPPLPVDAEYPQVLVVRDLGSGNQLLALPVREKSMGRVVEALEALFLMHGAPLVLKADNAFDAEEVRALLERWGVELLLSPPETPQYNGSVEAGIGALKTRAHHEAARNDRPGEWTCDDVEAARLAANELGRPWGHGGPSPDEKWLTRKRLTEEERRVFRDEVQGDRVEVRCEGGWFPGFELGRRGRAVIEREAIARALLARGYLEARRRQIPPPIFLRRMEKIT